MLNIYDLVLDITSRELPKSELNRALRDFSQELGWRPSYHIIEPPFVNEIAKAHLVVEHGLEPSAVITFLGSSNPLSELQLADKYHLLEISYNNLVDWHLYVEHNKVSFCFNRVRPFTIVETGDITRTNYDLLRNDAFDRVVGRKPNPNIKNLDEALMATISKWKRNLSADMGNIVSNENLSALFNAIIFTRAVEDHYGHINQVKSHILLEEWDRNKDILRENIKRSLRNFIVEDIPETIFNEQKLIPFDNLDPSTVSALFHDFYHNSYAPYNYDFSLMSKHALSRIYEHYSSILFIEDSPQASFFPVVPEEEWNKTYGSVYTPQFIAKFLAKFIREQKTPNSFRRMKMVDPACGSGIFLRTILELQCDPLQDGVNSEAINQAFENILGVDIDENAAQATRLSLALLYLTLMGKLPKKLNVLNEESIDYYQNHPELEGSFDVVIVNPPFISSGTQSNEMRQIVSNFMGEGAKGWKDTYLAFIKLGLDMLNEGGFGLYVLPHSFLISGTARELRQRLANETWIRCLADLSAIRVFGELGSYIILLIFEKKRKDGEKRPLATIIKCQDLVGHALQDYIDGRRTETNFYSIYDVGQREFERSEWVILPEVESKIKSKLNELKMLQDYAVVREGFITGADDVFIMDEKSVPDGERDIFIPFIPDRAMMRYKVPEDTEKRVFYPYVSGSKITLEELQDKYEKTWEYLCSKRKRLEGRRPVKSGNLEWWLPIWPRLPENLLVPKIISPHLVLLPKFSLDLEGKYAISRSPLIYPKEKDMEADLLQFLVAILNSPIAYWYITTHSHRYSRGYAMLEPKTLKQIPIPNPMKVSAKQMKELLDLVDRRIKVTASLYLDIENQIEEIVSDIYGLSTSERKALGIEN